MEIQDIINRLLLRFPLFGSVIVNLKFELVKSLVPADTYTDGETIFFKESLFEDYTEDEREFIVAHEIMHIVLSHVFRNIGRDPDLCNFVEDAIINQMLVRCGMTMPEGAVNVEDALSYSAEELYMKYLSRIDEIREWMRANTYHILMDKLSDLFEKMYSSDLNELMDANDEIKDNLCGDMSLDALRNIQKMNLPFGILLPAVNYGKSPSFVDWRSLLRKSLQSDDKAVVRFYEFEMDGILRREYKEEVGISESEVVIDTSASMSIAKIKVIIRECKNILKDGTLRVGFCDVKFYGWHLIKSESDIDKLEIKGRGGTDFSAMASAFSRDVQNKIVITDGGGYFPSNRPDILWIILESVEIYNILRESPLCLENANHIFVDTASISVPKEEKKLIRR